VTPVGGLNVSNSLLGIPDTATQQEQPLNGILTITPGSPLATKPVTNQEQPLNGILTITPGSRMATKPVTYQDVKALAPPPPDWLDKGVEWIDENVFEPVKYSYDYWTEGAAGYRDMFADMTVNGNIGQQAIGWVGGMATELFTPETAPQTMMFVGTTLLTMGMGLALSASVKGLPIVTDLLIKGGLLAGAAGSGTMAGQAIGGNDYSGKGLDTGQRWQAALMALAGILFVAAGTMSLLKTSTPLAGVEAAEGTTGLETRGFRPHPGTRQIPEGIPDGWRIGPTKGEGGTWYYDPANKGNAVRVMPGDPASPFPNSQAPYVRWQSNGRPLDVNGNPLPTKFSPDAHIPLQDFKFSPDPFK